ncbi:MAG: OadG family protein [Muribaculaceae bacterium]|nr:OadG family protein [Muribaculaceae bacterium]
MKYNKFILLMVCAFAITLTSNAQGRKNMRLNEVVVKQCEHCEKPSGWVELYNSSYGTNAIEKMFITNFKVSFPANVKKGDYLKQLAIDKPEECYEIPRGDERNTRIAPRTHVVFNADGDSLAGTFHLPFVFTPGQKNYIALYDVNGDLVDEVTVPASLQPGQSYAVDQEGRLPKIGANPADWKVRDNKTKATAITRGNYNMRAVNDNIEKFKEHDPHGFIITLFAMLIVFSTLFMLFILFKLFGKVMNKQSKNDVAKAVDLPEAAAQPSSTNADDEVHAAIFMALYQHLNAHDNESGILTFGNIQNSAWGDKGLLLRQLPQRK